MAVVFGCPVNRSIATLIQANVLDGSSPVQSIPYIGSFFRNRLNALDCHDVEDFVAIFSRTPARTAVDLEERLSLLFQNRKRASCVVGNENNSYHVSLVNQCGFNLSLSLLREFHTRRAKTQLTMLATR